MHDDIPQRRVIIRLHVNKFDVNGHRWEDHCDTIQAYFKWAGLRVLRNGHHKEHYFAHVEPLQVFELK